MESTYTDLAFYGGKTLCAGTDNGFSPISEVCDGTVSLINDTYERIISIMTVKMIYCPYTIHTVYNAIYSVHYTLYTVDHTQYNVHFRYCIQCKIHILYLTH